MIDWRVRLDGVWADAESKDWDPGPGPLRLRPGCSPAELAAAERRLGRAIPPPVAELLLATNGFGDEWAAYADPLDAVIDTNLWFAEDEHFDRSLFAFAGDGAGHPLCIAPDGTIHGWNAIDREAFPIARSLDELYAFPR